MRSPKTMKINEIPLLTDENGQPIHPDQITEEILFHDTHIVRITATFVFAAAAGNHGTSRAIMRKLRQVLDADDGLPGIGFELSDLQEDRRKHRVAVTATIFTMEFTEHLDSLIAMPANNVTSHYQGVLAPARQKLQQGAVRADLQLLDIHIRDVELVPQLTTRQQHRVASLEAAITLLLRRRQQELLQNLQNPQTPTDI